MPGSLVRTRSIFSAASAVPSATHTWPAWIERPMPTPPPWWIETQLAPDAVFTSALSSAQSAIVIGRDHLDCGSVASPYRETEAMLDGSDAIADWALLNALVNTASGATWVSIHHGGGVGIGRSIHAGQVCVADGTDLAAQKIERVLTNDPGMGVIRHVDAGYDLAVETAESRDVRVPMSEATPTEPARAE